MKYKIVLFVLLFVIIPTATNAAVIMDMGGGITTTTIRPFGGKLLLTFPCTCSNGWFLLLFDNTTRSPLPLVFQFSVSRLNTNYNIFTPGPNVVGSSVVGGVCMVYVGSSCVKIPTRGMVSPYPLPGIGTSLE